MSTQTIYDVIIIGGGPAGSTTATFLAKSGLQVLLLEKEKFPRFHVGESLLPYCYGLFNDLGVLAHMEKNYTRKPGVTFSSMNGSIFSNWCFSHVIKDPSYLSFHVNRDTFDKVLLDNSRQHGAEVLEQTQVTKVDFESCPQHVYVTALSNDSMETTYKSKFIVDASGQQTFLGKQLGSKKPFTSLTKRVAFFNQWENPIFDQPLQSGNIRIVHLEGQKLGWLWMIPFLELQRISVGVVVNMNYSSDQKKRLVMESSDWQQAFYLQEVFSSSVAENVLKDAKMTMQVGSVGDYSYYFEKKYSDRYCIVGDASAFLDPVFSSGIYLGMKSGQLVAEAISTKFKNNETGVMDDTYQKIMGAYRLVEKLINIFYEPDAIKFSEVDYAMSGSYEKFEAAYSILHLVLAGDFFNEHEKYIKAVDLLKDLNTMEKYKNLIGHPIKADLSRACL